MTTTIAVIGGTGQIGSAVLAALHKEGLRAVSVARSRPRLGSVDGIETREISAYTGDELVRALDSCDHAIVTLGLPYSKKVWMRQWPGLMREVADAALITQTPLTVLDNLYVYGDAGGAPLTEHSPLHPCSVKGQTRLLGLEELDRARSTGARITVCRSGDFIGPGAEVTVIPWSALRAVLHDGHRSLRWIGNPNVHHSYAGPRLVARGLLAVAVNPRLSAHDAVMLPPAEPFTGHDLALALSEETGHSVRLNRVGTGMIRIAALFSGAAREQREMMYQVNRDYTVGDSLFRDKQPHFPRVSVTDLVHSWVQSTTP